MNLRVGEREREREMAWEGNLKENLGQLRRMKTCHVEKISPSICNISFMGTLLEVDKKGSVSL